jgi:methylenetetrahydrofolate reductase (NADPH)
VNGVPSNDPKFGWGPKHGYVYQKAYYEFFIPKELIEPLVNFLERFPMITYQAINMSEDERLNVTKDDVNAVTWGVFKGKEVIQPTVVDHNAFLIWKDEAFAEWLDPWALVYGFDSPSAEFLRRCHDTLYLVNVVDNDYINGDLDKVFDEFIKENKALIESL